jgi:hypothetical protein
MRRLAALAGVTLASLAVLTGCHDSTTTAAKGLAGGTVATKSPGPAPSGTPVNCTDKLHQAVAAAVKVPISAGYNQLGGIEAGCWYGIGPNSKISGSSVIVADSDTVLVTILTTNARHQYDTAVGVGPLTDLKGVGDQAKYAYSGVVQGVPDFFAIKGGIYCNVHMTISDTATELGIKAGGGNGVPKAAAVPIARSEGDICDAVFAGA